jgi:hypothetical protein
MAINHFFECTNTKCGHHYTKEDENVPFSNKCPLCGSPGRPERAVEGWCKGANGESCEVDL